MGGWESDLKLAINKSRNSKLEYGRESQVLNVTVQSCKSWVWKRWASGGDFKSNDGKRFATQGREKELNFHMLSGSVQVLNWFLTAACLSSFCRLLNRHLSSAVSDTCNFRGV